MGTILRKTVSETFLARVETSSSEVGFQFKPTYGDRGPVGQWRSLTYGEFFQECRLVSFGLMGLGVRPGDRVALLSSSRIEWSLSDLAILGAKAVTVPLDMSSSPEEIAFRIRHSGARIAIVEDATQLQKVLNQKTEPTDEVPLVDQVVVFEPSAMRSTIQYAGGGKNILTFQALQELGRRTEAKDPVRFEANLKSAQPDDLLTISYTSGTTGLPKGVLITHDNMMSVLEDYRFALGPFLGCEREVVLSFLPFSQGMGKVESLAVIALGWKQVFAENLEHENLDRWMSTLQEIKPTLLFSVPRLFERVYRRLFEKVEQESQLKKSLFTGALGLGQKYFRSIWSNQKPSFKDRVAYQAAKLAVFRPILQSFGGRLRFALCGGAPLPREIGELFQIVGITLLEGYGLTETSAPVTLNTPDSVRFGSGGRPLPEVSIKIASDGEILVQSRKVFQSYWKAEEESSQVLKEGWLYTGDVGHLDSDGFLWITDRKKDLIFTRSGKKIAPQKIENLARSRKLMTHFVVCGEGRPYLTALVTLDPEQVLKFAHENQILFSEYAELIKNPKILSWVQIIIDEMNSHLASFEAIQRFVILPSEFTVQGGELASSLKIRRWFINKKYKAILESLYSIES